MTKQKCDEISGTAKHRCDKTSSMTKHRCGETSIRAKHRCDGTSIRAKHRCDETSSRAKHRCDERSSMTRHRYDDTSSTARHRCDETSSRAKHRCDETSSRAKHRCDERSSRAPVSSGSRPCGPWLTQSPRSAPIQRHCSDCSREFAKQLVSQRGLTQTARVQAGLAWTHDGADDNQDDDHPQMTWVPGAKHFPYNHATVPFHFLFYAIGCLNFLTPYLQPRTRPKLRGTLPVQYYASKHAYKTR
eukprot:1159480-Pelagomonas_calceolata.AAC.2